MADVSYPCAASTMPVMPLTQAVGQHAFSYQFMLTTGIRF